MSDEVRTALRQRAHDASEVIFRHGTTADEHYWISGEWEAAYRAVREIVRDHAAMCAEVAEVWQRAETAAGARERAEYKRDEAYRQRDVVTDRLRSYAETIRELYDLVDWTNEDEDRVALVKQRAESALRARRLL